MSSKIQGFFEGLYESVEEQGLSYVVSYFRDTPTGSTVEKKITSVVISDYLKNPIVLIVIAVILFLIFKGMKKG